ncbi:hypothetical protein ACRAWF_39395 [Streptomyces sp. L7]
MNVIAPVLHRRGVARVDLAYRLPPPERDAVPGIYSVANGATTVWERWNSYSEEGTASVRSTPRLLQPLLLRLRSWSGCYGSMAGIMPRTRPTRASLAAFTSGRTSTPPAGSPG